MARPTSLNQQVQDKICEEVRKGVPYEISCFLAGVTARSVQNWKNQGESDCDAGIDSIYAVFFLAVKKAEAECVSNKISVITSCGDNWQAIAWLFERRHKKEFGKEPVKEDKNELEQKKPLEPHEVMEKLASLPEYVLEAILKEKRSKKDV